MPQSILPIPDEVEGNRVEDVSQDPEVGQQLDASELGLHTPLPQPGLELGPYRPGLRSHVIAIVEPGEVESVVGEEPQIVIQRRQLIEIDERVPDRVGELAYRFVHPAVPDPAQVEGRGRHQNATPRSPATETADAKPSSWKPLPKYAPQKWVRLRPLIRPSSDWVSTLSAVKIGWV